MLIVYHTSHGDVRAQAQIGFITVLVRPLINAWTEANQLAKWDVQVAGMQNRMGFVQIQQRARILGAAASKERKHAALDSARVFKG